MGLSAGQAFGRYVIEGLLGEGGMGRVYRARDTRLEREVALKILIASPDADAARSSEHASQGAARLLREARAAAALDHPNAVGIFEVGDEAGVPYIAMELVVGRPLRAFIGDETPPLARKIKWLVEIARALGAAHDRGLVHRDVKPENVIVRSADGVAKVLDFGIARRVKLVTDDSGSTATITRDGLLVGTPVYMAPETLRGDPIDGRADQFSWGVVAYELLTGAPPWSAMSGSVSLLSDILSKQVPPIVTRGAPAAVDAIVRKALEKSPRGRFDAMEDIAIGLDVFASAAREPIEIPSTEAPPPPTARTSDPAVRTLPDARAPAPRRAAAVVTAIALAACAGVIVARPWRASPQAQPASSPALPSASSPATASALRSTAPAERLYRSGLEAVRDASIFAGVHRFHAAVAADADFAPPRVRLALLYAWQGEKTDARVHYRAALQARATLDDRDRALLDASEPEVVSEPPDSREAARRLTVLATRYADDAEIAFYAGREAQRSGDTAAAQAQFDHALAIDPKLAAVWWARAIAAEDAGDLDAALRAYDTCLETSSGAASCLRSRATIYAQRGQCAALEEDARRMLAIESNGARAYDFLARALASRGRALEAVHEALAQKWAALPEAERRTREHADRARLAMLRGDFSEAAHQAKALDDQVATDSSEIAHIEPALLEVEIALEVGDDKRAAEVARHFCERRVAWVSSPALGSSVRAALPRLIAVERRSGSLSADAFRAARDEWLRDAKASSSPLWVNELWTPAFAAPAETPDEAMEALAALPSFSPLPPARELSLSDAAVGRAMLLAGRAAEATPYLARATASCLSLDEPIAHTRAFFDRGRALEAAGDSGGACAAYATVVARWGKAKPRSMTAERAAQRVAALRCPR